MEFSGTNLLSMKQLSVNEMIRLRYLKVRLYYWFFTTGSNIYFNVGAYSLTIDCST